MRTRTGTNRSGMQISPSADEMLHNVRLANHVRGDERGIARLRADYAAEAEPVGTLPDPQEGAKAVLMDKLGERLAFERAGTRLYDALIAKCRALGCGIPEKEVLRVRDEEAAHFELVGAAIHALGGDRTEQTPGADLAGVEASGLMQVLTDPKTSVPQALHAMLVAEMTDNAGWDELVELASQLGDGGLVQRFAQAREAEKEHLENVRRWYRQATAAMMQES